MKIKNLLMIFAITFSGLVVSACSDESEDILPAPLHNDEAPATVGTGGKSGDPMGD